MLKKYIADLHIHTCLSPCADIDMTPSNIVNEAIEKKIDIIAITDHNSSKNAEAAIEAANQHNITVIPGMEVTTSEEVHIIALFLSIEQAKDFQNVIYENLLSGENDELLYGDQIIVNSKDEVLDFEKKLLIGATMLGIDMLIDIVHSLNGIAIASHIDREHFSLISQLGFIPETLEIDALEVSSFIKAEDAYNRFGNNKKPLVSFSDAHYLNDIGKRYTEFYMSDKSFFYINEALTGSYAPMVNLVIG